MLFSHWRLTREPIAPCDRSSGGSNHLVPAEAREVERGASHGALTRAVSFRAWGLLLAVAIFAPAGLADGRLIPRNGCGINWRTVAPAQERIRLASGEQVTYQPQWAAYPTAPNLLYFAYDVRLNRQVIVNGVTKDTIRVWVLPSTRPPGVTQQEWDNLTYWCSTRSRAIHSRRMACLCVGRVRPRSCT
jgi:hypothetical protein